MLFSGLGTREKQVVIAPAPRVDNHPWEKFCTKAVEKSPEVGCGWVMCGMCVDVSVDTVELPVPGRQVNTTVVEERLCPPVMSELDFPAFERDTLLYGHCKVWMNLSGFLILSLFYFLFSIWCEPFFPRVCI